MANLNNTETQKYFYFYLSRTKLNELMWRANSSRLTIDVYNKFLNQNIKDQYISTEVKQSPTKNDVYLIINMYVSNEEIGHITFHLTPFNLIKGSVGPLHIKNKKQSTSRIRVTRKQTQQPYIQLSIGTNIYGSSSLNNRVQTFSNAVLDVLNDYFDPKSPNSLLHITYKTQQPYLERVIQEIENEFQK